MRPIDKRYSETHEWVKVDGDDAIIGITDYAVNQLSDLVHLELPEVGDNVESDAPLGEIESVKTVSDLIAPITGEIVAVNDKVVKDLDVLSEDPFEDGWLVRVRIADKEELENLMSAQEYEEFVETAEEEEEEEKTSVEGEEEDEEDEEEDEKEEKEKKPS